MIWFSSDQHFFHNNVIKYCSRPFSSVEEMTEVLVERHNSLIKPGDTVYHLGDFSLNKRAPGEILPRLNGEHHLIAGNHDWCHPVHGKKKVDKFIQIYLDAGFKTIKLTDTILIGGQLVLMHHLPYLEDNPEFDQRYPQYRPVDAGMILLHGHVHGTYKTKLSSKGTMMINVGVDVNDFYPVSLDQITELIE